jgi:hypothetical protein
VAVRMSERAFTPFRDADDVTEELLESSLVEQ